MNKFLDNVFESEKRGKIFYKMSRAELATELTEKVWADMEAFTYESDLVSAIIDRLHGVSWDDE